MRLIARLAARERESGGTGMLARRGMLRRTMGALTVVASMSACSPPPASLTITDFSRPVRLHPAAPGQQTVGLILEGRLQASAPIALHLGCDGRVQTTVTIPPGQKFSQRMDWYSDCAEVSFSTGQARASSLALTYRFQTL